MFIGREDELGALEYLYSSKSRRTCAVYGRRRIGKTSLIERFCEGKDSIRFSYIRSTEQKNLDRMVVSISRFTGEEYNPVKEFDQVLDILSEIISSRKIVIFMDEFPYFVESAPHVPFVLQHFIDHELKNSDSMLIVCGSSVSMMKEQLDGADMPLYGRFMNRIELKPLPYWVCEKMHPDLSRMDFLKTYLTIGGFPAYHELMDQSSYKEFIKCNFLGAVPFLMDEAELIVSRELSAHPIINALLSDIASGTTSIKELAEKEGISKMVCGRYLNLLEDLGIVDSLVPMANADKKKKILRISDPLLDFRYRVLDANSDIVELSDRDHSYEMISHNIDSFLGKCFEKICSDYLRARFPCKAVGTWWGWTGEETTDIDVVADAYIEKNRVMILAECKFTRKPVGISLLKELEFKSGFVKGVNNIRFMLFSVSGFTEELKDLSESRGDLELVDMDDLFSF